MCFGEKETGSKQTDYQTNPVVGSAATQNLSFAQNLQNAGATPFNGQMVAPISGQQKSSFDMADTIGASPNWGTAQGYVNSAATAAPSSVNAGTIASKMDPYMNQYVAQALAPQLEAQKQQFDSQNRGAASNSTMAGAFGNDSQDALYRSNLTNQQDTARQGLIGQAYTNAFNTAIGAGAQDVANDLGAQTTNANLNEQALQRQMQGATGLENLQTGREGATSLVNQMGQQQTAQSQAQDNAQYQEFLRQQQYPFLSTELLNQTVGAGAQAFPAASTQTTSAPDNSGFALAGAMLPTMMGFADGGDPPVGVPSLVGERGPELVIPSISSATPNVMPAVKMPSPMMPSIAPMQAPQPQQQQAQAGQTTTAGGALLSGLQHPIGGFSFGGTSSGPETAVTGLGESMGDPTMLSGFYAQGGNPPVGQAAVVGENGPEVIVPKRPLTVIPNHQLKGHKPIPKNTTDPLAEQMGLAA